MRGSCKITCWYPFVATAAVVLLFSACSRMSDAADDARTRITRYLNGIRIYERNNLPDPEPAVVEGYYDIVAGAYRYVTNENRDGREQQRKISEGNLVSFFFDARIFSGTFANSATYYTNIQTRIKVIAAGNYEFNTEFWPTDSLRVKIGERTILNALENALISCREGDEIQIYLTPDIAYGDRQVGIIPSMSTVVFELTSVRVLE